MIAWACSLLALAGSELRADEPAAKDGGEKPAVASVEKLVETVRKSIVVITFSGRDGTRQGLGTGFVVGADGLIATNLHVIGEGRPIAVETRDGRRHEVTAVHASDRAADLALLRIDAQGLDALELADSDSLKQGQPIVAIGNPHGLTHSVVTGVVSGEREIDGRKMIQLAIPIEPGNSGGPLLDMEGRVHGLLTMKSAVTANLGFAVPSNRLKPLLEKPNPIAIESWLLIGALDAKRWTPLFGARWRQRAGRITVDGAGAGFGGRSLCLTKQETPVAPYELAAVVKLDDEAGAAGLVFGSDGADRHFGFYPSAGKLRLSRFDGPDVTSWQVLEEKPSPHYRPGDWNRLKVRVEADKVLCYVNDHLVIESPAAPAAAGQTGLAKFRDTRAEFKQFRLAKELPSQRPSDELLQKVEALAKDIPPTGPLAASWAAELAAGGDDSLIALGDRAKLLDQQAAQLRKLASAVHQRRVLTELQRVLDEPDFELFHAALLVAWLDNDELDVEAYRGELERLAGDLKASLPADADEAAKRKALNEFLFAANGFHGSRADYYNRSNSYVNEVLDDREGLPITLSLIYIELARKIGLNVVGVGLPGHFIVKHVPAKGEEQLIDVFDAGAPLSREQAEAIVRGAAGRALTDEDLKPVDGRAILVRMLYNLRGIAERKEDVAAMLRYSDGILAISPELAEEHMFRAIVRYRSGLGQQALEDLDWVIEHESEGVELERVKEFRASIERSAGQD